MRSIGESRLYDTTCFFLGSFFLSFSMFILPLPSLALGCKSTSLSPWFCVYRPRQYNTICWDLNLISGYFAFFWLIVWSDGINKCAWCLAGGTRCWLQGPHQVPNISWIRHHYLDFHIYQIALFVPEILSPLYCYYQWWRDGICGGWLIYNWEWRGPGVGIVGFFFLLHLCVCPLFFHVLCSFF